MRAPASARPTVGRVLVVALALGLGLAATPASADPSAPAPVPVAAPATVSDVIVGFTFLVGSTTMNAPDQMVRIHTGDVVEWTNLDPVSHSVAFDALPTTLYLKKPGDKGSVTFTQAGYYVYRCNEHPEFPGMKGLVFVTD